MTFPGATTYPGSATYPGGPVPSGASTLTLTAEPILALPVVQLGSAVLIFTADPVLLIGSPTRGFATLTLTAAPTLSFTQFGSISSNPSIAAFPEPDNWPPRVLIQVSNVAGPSAQILRYGPDGQATPVRSGDLAPLNSGTWLGYDVEPIYNTGTYYKAVPTDGSAAVTSPAVRLEVGRPWFVHPGVPDLSMPLTVRLLDDETTTSGGGLKAVLSRRTPIPVTDGQRKAPTFQMQIKTATTAERERFDQLFADTAPLLLQVVYPDRTDEAVYMWVFISDITRSRLPSASFENPKRVWTLQCAEVDRPAGPIRSQRTWRDVMAECPTWLDVPKRYKTWRGVLTGIEGT